MRDYHLSVLGLDSSASKDDIKSAYRKLSKRYHPDINKSPNAHEQFIRINEAYENLESTPTQQIFTSFYNEVDIEEQQRMEYKRRAREREIEYLRHQQKVLKRVLFVFTPAAIGILLLNILLAADYYLPLQNHTQSIIGKGKVLESHSRNAQRHRYDEIYFNDFTMRFDHGEILNLDHYDKAIVQATLIFSMPIYAIITVDGRSQRFQQAYNIYNIFGYLIPVMIVLGGLFFLLKKPIRKLNISIVLLMFFLLQLYVFLT